MTLGWTLFFAGALQFLAAWLFFRHPGQKFWVIAPIWRAAQFLSPLGVSLWVCGTTLMTVGGISVIMERIA
jgi:hypothetical protein